MQTPAEDGASSDRGTTILVAKATAAALAVGALGFGIWQLRSVLILLLLAVTLAAAIRPGVEWLERRHVPESVSILLHFAVVGGAVGLLLWLAVPPALHQIGHALGTSPAGGGVRVHALTWLRQHLDQLPKGTELLHPVATYGHKTGEAVVGVFFTLAATWYCVSERDSIIKLLTVLAPEAKRDKARETYLALDRRLGAYTRLRFLMVFAVGAVLSAGFAVIGLNYWLLVGSFVGLVEIVPVLGPIVGSLLVLAVGLPQSVHIAVLALLWLVLVREFQTYVVNPRIGQTIGLSPLVTLLSVAVVGVLFGGFAVILAVPFTSAVATLIDVLVLGHEPPAQPVRRSPRLRRPPDASGPRNGSRVARGGSRLASTHETVKSTGSFEKEEEAMAGENVVVVRFTEPSKAYQALSVLKECDADGRIGLESAAIVERTQTGELHVPESADNFNLVGTASGSLIGMLIGTLGGPVGLLLGWGAGAMLGGAFDIDRAIESEGALTTLGTAIPVGSTAVIASVEEPVVEVIDAEMAMLGGEVTRRPVAEVRAELDAAEAAADAAAFEAQRTILEQRKDQLSAGVHERAGKLKELVHTP